MEINSVRKEFRKFRNKDFYDDLKNEKVTLLPFNFRRLNSGKELLISMVGDFVIVPNGTIEKIIKK